MALARECPSSKGLREVFLGVERLILKMPIVRALEDFARVLLTDERVAQPKRKPVTLENGW